MAARTCTVEIDNARRARSQLPEVVRVLVEELGVRRVILFGSLLDGRLHERSDIDLAVEGLAPERYWEALWRCSKAAQRHVDLVPLGEASASLRDHIRERGEVLYG